ncbi:AbiH family protein [Butyrivibrio sp. MC2021]|uniref:AbiH family protein n=1 Tax=Butyrivibrio sp. MC2021 TaxID=1408306 RepID=UPI00047E6D3C|nr:AbiH family protein [Butyrivibrio sp. MC2021]
MKILIVGNGFDLEHKLGTQYTQFMDFVKWITTREYPIPEGKWKDDAEKLKKYNIDTYEKLSSSNPQIIKEFNELIKDNFWLHHFEKVRGENNKTWIDFESEVASLMRVIEKFREAYLNRATFENEALDSTDEERFFYLSVIYGYDINTVFAREFEGNTIGGNKISNGAKKFNGSSFDGKTFNDIRDLFLKHLRKLARALEIYFVYWIDPAPVDIINPAIMKIHPNKVISFNYTHTFEKVYRKNDVGVEYCYIHGEAKKNSTFESNEMVLGIHDNSDKIGEYDYLIGFKKYYQKLFFGTDTTYKKWFKEIDANDDKKHEVFIFGHSLDVTDKEIFAPLLDNENVITTIYCKDKKKRGELISKVIALIGKDKTIQKMYSGKLIFKVQPASLEIKESELEVKSDIYDLYRLDELEFDIIQDLLKKIREKITGRELNYFHATNYAIDIGDALDKFELLTDDLLEGIKKIIFSTMSRESRNEPFDVIEWFDLDGGDNPIIRLKTGKLVDFANSCLTEKKENLADKYPKESLVCNKQQKEPKDMDENDFCDAFNLAYEQFEKLGLFEQNYFDYFQELISCNYSAAHEGVKLLKELLVSKDNDFKQIYIAKLENYFYM